MTREQARMRNFHEAFPCNSYCTGGFTEDVSNILPETPNSIVNQEVAESPKRFNSLSLDDLSSFRKVKGSDPLHRADKLAKSLDRGKKLNNHLSSKGAKDFLKYYE